MQVNGTTDSIIMFYFRLPRACFALSRLVLSLDPLRDPMGVLLALDYFGLQLYSENSDEWLVDFVQNTPISIYYEDDIGSLLDLPNWSYSYALALFRMAQKDDDENQSTLLEKADQAMKDAMQKFPSVVEELLLLNEVDITSRSFRRDWSPLLNILRQWSEAQATATSGDILRAYDLIVRVFLQQNFKLWGADSVLDFIYRNLSDMMESKNPGESKLANLSPVLRRYGKYDPKEYTDDKFETMPIDVNPLQPQLVQYALTIDTNRPRLMRQRGGADEQQLVPGFDFQVNERGAALAGPPTELIDPDWPLLEVFWRSALPWAHVEGVPPLERR